MNQERPLIQNRPGPDNPQGPPPQQGGFQQPAYQPEFQEPQRQPSGPQRSKWLIPALAVLGLLVIAAAVWFFALRDSGTDDGAADPVAGSDETPEVVVIDESEVDVVQNPSLSATATADGVRVENDGNVTMHDITVTEGGNEVCAIETLSPGDGSDCAGATAAAVVAGLGPQDQPVEINVG